MLTLQEGRVHPTDCPPESQAKHPPNPSPTALPATAPRQVNTPTRTVITCCPSALSALKMASFCLKIQLHHHCFMKVCFIPHFEIITGIKLLCPCSVTLNLAITGLKKKYLVEVLTPSPPFIYLSLLWCKRN